MTIHSFEESLSLRHKTPTDTLSESLSDSLSLISLSQEEEDDLLFPSLGLIDKDFDNNMGMWSLEEILFP